MAKGFDKNQARRDEMALHGKDLARRAKRKCELCEDNDDLRPYDTEPDNDPALDTLVLLCARCRALADGQVGDPRTLRFLASAVWNEEAVVAATARRLISTVDADWARDTLELLG